MSIYRGDTLIAGAGGPTRNIGEIVPSLLPLTDAGLHLLDGALISGSGIYSAFVTYIAGLVSSYPNLFVTEANWQSSVSAYGVCGKFVYDSTANTVRLPKVTGIIEGTVSVSALGDLVEAGLPNIKGETGWITAAGASAVGAGAIYWKGTANNITSRTSSSNIPDALAFDASRSNSIYGNSSTVQPQTIKAYYYIVIANSTKTSIQVDVDEIATDLNNKVSKSGDTMNGILTLDNTSGVHQILKSTIIDQSVSPDTSQYDNYIDFVDKNNNRFGRIFSYKFSNGNQGIGIQAWRGSQNADWRIGVDNNGNAVYPKPQIIENYVNGTSWYRVWSDGWIEQGGRASIASHQYGSTSVSLLKTMSNTNYSITIGGQNSTQNGNYVFTVGSSITTSSFAIWDERSTGGNHTNYCYWRVEGY